MLIMGFARVILLPCIRLFFAICLIGTKFGTQFTGSYTSQLKKER